MEIATKKNRYKGFIIQCKKNTQFINNAQNKYENRKKKH